jgi:anion-transporting  ArsA/GET3 family ATPase
MTAGMGVVTNTMAKVVGAQVLKDLSMFVAAFDTLFGGFRNRAQQTYQLLQTKETAFLVAASPEADALREAAYFVDRLAEESMPLAGLVLNRTHPVLAPGLSAGTARHAAERAEQRGGGKLTAAVLRLHADRVELAERERRMLSRFCRAHPHVPVAQVAAVPGPIADLDSLREIGSRLTAASP